MKRIAAIAALVLGAVLVVAPAVGATTGGVCEDNGTKVNVADGQPSVTVTAPEGKLIAGYCVKAGSDEQGNGPEYVVVDPPAAEVTITHTSGKDVSHYTLTLVDEPPASTTTTVVDREVGVTVERVCKTRSSYEAFTVATLTFENPVGEWATVDVLGGVGRMRPFSIVVATHSYTEPVTVPYVVEWDDGPRADGSVELVPIGGCLPPCPERVNGPTCPETTVTYPPSLPPCPPLENGPPCPVTSLPPVVATTTPTRVLASSPSIGDGEVDELAVTGSEAASRVAFGVVLVGVGALALGGAWLTRRRT